MERQQMFRLLLTSEARDFLHSLPAQATKKLYNIDRIAAAEKNIELFKKLESSDIW